MLQHEDIILLKELYKLYFIIYFEIRTELDLPTFPILIP